ncbi:hypothetical protein ACFO5R_01690 [Halosolutus amylolyticus]|uniref:Uncharacterized protein n=1 Tax=Halosolutus amylolyticus TaxID=2932267 RepID=A0ABD5PJP0_9EURY|nr:hypothetical protein [Halosolutus amylolyticus]
MVEREQLIEIAVAVTAVFLMIGIMIGIGSMYGGDNGSLSSDGGEMLVGAIVGFIFLLTAVGIGLAYVLNDPDDDLDPDEDADSQSAV